MADSLSIRGALKYQVSNTTDHNKKQAIMNLIIFISISLQYLYTQLKRLIVLNYL